MMLRKVVMLVLLSIILVVPALEVKPVREITYFPSVAAKISSDPERIANDLTIKYLRHYESRLIPLRARLEDYSIKELKVFRQVDQSFVYTVKFSVKTASRTSDWVMGNGYLAYEGWIEDKVLYVTVKKQGSRYQIEHTATSFN